MTTTDDAVVLDGAGRLRAAASVVTSPAALAESVCRALHDLVGREAAVVSCSVGQGPRPFALTMLRDVSDGGFHSGVGSGDDAAAAIVAAVQSALDISDSIFATAADLWHQDDDVRAVSVVEGDMIGPASGDDRDLDDHVKLVQLIPAPGRLAVRTEDVEYRVLRFPASALSVSTTPNARALHELDAWMAKAEAIGP